MKKIKFHIDLLQILFSLFFIVIMVVAFFCIIQPFILSFTWAGIIVITTWPLINKLEYLFWRKRKIAIFVMTIILILVFVIPIAYITNYIINNGVSFLHWIFQININTLQFSWLENIPIIGNKLFIGFNKIINSSYYAFISKIQPYIGTTTGFFFAQASYFGHFMIHLGLMLLFSIFIYFNGESITHTICNFAYRVSGYKGKATVLIAGKIIRSVVLGIVVTAIVQGILSGIGLFIVGMPYTPIVVLLMIFLCLLQIGPLPILIPTVIWLYCNNENAIYSYILLIWSIFVAVIDNILKPILIRIGNNIPLIITLSGTIGGFLAFGMIGLFIGPVILAISYRLIFAWMNEVLPSNKICIDIFEKDHDDTKNK